MSHLNDVLGKLSSAFPGVPSSLWAEFSDAIRNAVMEDIRKNVRTAQRKAEMGIPMEDW